MTTKHVKATLILAACLAASSALAGPAATADEAARHTLGQLPTLGTRGFRTLGLAGEKEARRSKLGTPLKVYMVGLDALRTYEGGPTDELLIDLQNAFYPVIVDGEVTSSLGVQQTAEGFETREIRSAELAKLVVQMRSAAMTAEKQQERAYYLIRIPALQMAFLAQGQGPQLTLRSVSDIPEVGLAANTAISGTELFAKLAPVARAFQGMEQPQP